VSRQPYQGSPAWLEERRGGYGSSDVPILTDGDEQAWVRLHLRKLGVLPEQETTESMEIGKDLEPAIARMVQRRLGEPVIRVNRILRHPELDFVRASLDRRTKRGHKPIELKKWGFRTEQFGPEGSAYVPTSMLYQVQQQLAVTRQPEADLFVLFAGVELRRYRIGADQGLIDDLIALEAAAWPFVERGEVPAWPGPAPERPQLKADEIPADDEILMLIEAHEVAAVEAEQAEEALKSVKDRLRVRLEEAGGTRGALGDGRRFSVSHRPNRDSTVVDWEHLYIAARKRLRELGISEEELDFASNVLTTTRPGARPLRVTISQPKEERSAA
jgi:putative phage-type endonuclease